jgi:hypothetical protein
MSVNIETQTKRESSSLDLNSEKSALFKMTGRNFSHSDVCAGYYKIHCYTTCPAELHRCTGSPLGRPSSLTYSKRATTSASALSVVNST